MPALYFQQTDPAAQQRHEEKFAQLAGGTENSGMLVDPVEDADGGWHVEIVTLDWDEPGLLDKIFEGVLRCTYVPGGIALKQAQIFTGREKQVVNILYLENRKGKPLTRELVEIVIKQLGEVLNGERGVLETIAHMFFPELIPQLNTFPLMDNERDEHWTYLELKVNRLSHRFTSILLHHLARSELWLNIQVAEFSLKDHGTYSFYVVDKYGRKLRDSQFFRLTMVRALEAMNDMVMRFNIQHLLRAWHQRIDKNNKTIYHSRPNVGDFHMDIRDVLALAELKGAGNTLGLLVENGLLESRDYYFLKKVEAFIEQSGGQITAMREEGAGEEAIALCRVYFDYRQRALRILGPLFHQLAEMAEVSPSLSDEDRTDAMASPLPHQGYLLDTRMHLYRSDSPWMREPIDVLDLFHLMARTDGFLRPDMIESVEAALEGWDPYWISEHRKILGKKFLAVFDESIAQRNTAIILRNLRNVGLLQRYLPGFKNLEGLVHVVADHAYTVDEHTFVLVEALVGMALLVRAIPFTGESLMRSDFENLTSGFGLQQYARKYAMQHRMLERVPEVRRNPALKPFFQMMSDVRYNTLEFVVEINFLEQGHSTCMGALTKLESIRTQLSSLTDLFGDLPFSDQRLLVLAGLLHDIKKPHMDHGALGAKAIPEILDAMGLEIPEKDVEQLIWLVGNHLEIRPLMNRMGAEGENALLEFAKKAGDVKLTRLLILLTYADRVATYSDQNKNAHDAMVLSNMLKILNQTS